MRKYLYLKINVAIEGDDLSPSVMEEFLDALDYDVISNTKNVAIDEVNLVEMEVVDSD